MCWQRPLLQGLIKCDINPIWCHAFKVNSLFVCFRLLDVKSSYLVTPRVRAMSTLTAALETKQCSDLRGKRARRKLCYGGPAEPSYNLPSTSWILTWSLKLWRLGLWEGQRYIIDTYYIACDALMPWVIWLKLQLMARNFGDFMDYQGSNSLNGRPDTKSSNTCLISTYTSLTYEYQTMLLWYSISDRFGFRSTLVHLVFWLLWVGLHYIGW